MTTSVDAHVEVFHHDDTPNDHYVLITGEIFGPYSSEQDAVLAVGPCLLTME